MIMRVTGGVEDFVLLDNGFAADEGCWLLEGPERIIECCAPGSVEDSLAVIQAAVDTGLYAAGFFAYELGYVLEPALAPLLPVKQSVPLLRVGLFRGARRLSAPDARRWLQARATATHTLSDLRPSLARGAYRAAFDAVRAFIAAGDVYQINLTFKQRFTFAGDPLSLYLDLRRRQRVSHGGMIVMPDLHVLSLSPELFLRLEGGRALVRPMKGTAGRGVTDDEDRGLRAWLARDEKSCAENLMIVDLMRNDLSRLARPGDVRVTDLFTVETFRTPHQMTSGVEATMRPGVTLADLLRALFPCGSVTGAPKIRAMQIIRALEPEPRGVYTGAIGMIAPGGRVLLSVAIRTLVLHADGRGEMGISTGIVFDPEADREYDECLLKAHFLTEAEAAFALVETLRWERGCGYTLLDRHLARLATSAGYFTIPCDSDEVRRALTEATCCFGDNVCRVRLLLREDGEMTISAVPMPQVPPILRYAVSPRPASSRDPFRYHKTTRRSFYEGELARLGGETGCDEVLFVNERGELTEGARTNLFVRCGGRLLTPPVACGLLDGMLRQELLTTRPDEVAEAVLRPSDLADADAVLLGSSVRWPMPARPTSLGIRGSD
jgi:para-aminobenzoate synthetase/4-amino-4-deoxychorismate lyase